MSKRWGSAVAVVGVVLGAACQEDPAAGPWIVGSEGAHVELYVEQAYLPAGASTRVTAVAYDEKGERGTGSVRLAANAGSFAGGSQVELALAGGSATTTYRCDAAADPRCTGIVALEATWGEQRTANTVNLDYAVTSGGGAAMGGGGSSSSGAPAAARNLGDPNKVYLKAFGVSPVEDPDKVTTSLDVSSGDGDAVVRPTDGAILYVASAPRAVLVFVPDALVHPPGSTAWTLPDSLRANDQPVPTPSCDGPVFLHMRPVSGAIVYSCGGDSYYDVSAPGGGAVLSGNDSVIAAAPQRNLLVWRNGTVQVGTLDGGFKQFSGFSNPISSVQAARWRRSGGGWWMVGSFNGETGLSLWSLTEAGSATRVGSYPASLSSFDRITLDGDGNAYTIKSRTSPAGAGYGVVVRYEPPPDDTPTDIASDLNGTPTNLTQTPPHLRNKVLGGYLFTGP
ncbi:hypothetical protein FGE12_21535 [Aggregicoccus sp. 17bor-14]|uniref:hypothetical protein n=1 Tax=Myxococcaceae TaxID=31 RepID=UPI00129C6A31|nr:MULTISPECIES: hypothetical protein [Myxococcaceae]MBF5044999.1 hypothetical protein [Simulacricoccus sp. 17bor-14]MRI90742.1 hypothetical protein [Aggregicoccus sp. 17bor-14]